ncbi:MAG: hypothetical protein JNL98_36280 [Bryobacterales bacterium]|nr:hypothetical protein [Bryobacterales bacterium]
MAWVKSWWERWKFGWWGDITTYTLSEVRYHARQDAELSSPVPGWDDETCPWFVAGMKEHFDGIVRGILGQFQKEDAAHQLRIVQLKKESEAADQSLARAQGEYEMACKYFKEKNPEIPPDTVKNRVLSYWLITAFFLVLEFPMNFSAFKLFGENAGWLTGATALAIGGSLLVLAHYLGVAWRKGPSKDRGALLDVILLVSLAFLAILSVAELRTAYLSHNPELKLPSSALLMRAFAIFNLMIFGCAAFLSRHRHMTGIEHVESAGRVLRAARSRKERLDKELALAERARETLRVTRETEAHQVTDQHLELFKLYHMYNRRARQDAGEERGILRPKYFDAINTSPLVSLPKHFTQRIGGQAAADSAAQGAAVGPAELPDDPSPDPDTANTRPPASPGLHAEAVPTSAASSAAPAGSTVPARTPVAQPSEDLVLAAAARERDRT